MDRITVDDDMKITDLQAHFHPSAVGAPKPKEDHDAIDLFAQAYADALWHHDNDDLLNLFANTGEASWIDPVGTPAHVGRDKIAERISKLPDMDFVKVKEVFYTVSNKIFMVTVEVKFKNK